MHDRIGGSFDESRVRVLICQVGRYLADCTSSIAAVEGVDVLLIGSADLTQE